jgi:predicted ester cyclase
VNTEKILRAANERLLEMGDLDAVDEIFAADYVSHAGGKTYKGRAFVKRFVRELRKSIPKLRVVEIEILLESGNTVAWRRALAGKFEQPMRKIPASGRKIQWSDMLVSRFDGEAIAEEWGVSELAGAMMIAVRPGKPADSA